MFTPYGSAAALGARAMVVFTITPRTWGSLLLYNGGQPLYLSGLAW